MNYVMLGKRIRDERLLLRLTIEQLAERVDKSLNFIGQIERGEGKPSIETLVDLANALGTTVDTLLADSLRVGSEDTAVREMTALLMEIDAAGRQFLLEVVKRYAFHHRREPEKNS